MIEEKAKFVIGEIKNISRYDKIIESLNNDLAHLADQMDAISTPMCPQGNIKFAPVTSPADKTSRVLELITEEQELIAERSEFEKRKQEALKFKTTFFEQCPVEEVYFCSDFFNGTSYDALRMRHHVTHPYMKVLRIVKSVL